MNRKAISVLLIVMMLFSIVSPAFAADTSVVVEAGTATGKAGDTVVVELKVTENTGFNMLNIVAKYDTNALEFVEVTSPVDKNELDLESEVVNNDIRMMFEEANEENYTSKDVVLAELTFKIKDECVAGNYAITLVGYDEPCYDTDLVDVPLTLVDGSVVVEADAAATYAVTVNGGNGSGDYEVGATVAITATVPEGKEFVNWTGVGVTFADANAAATSFTMPANNVTVTANFKDIVVEPVTYAVTVNGGTGAGNYEAGATVTITATVPEGKEFVNWTGDVTFVNANAAATSFTMPANNVTVTANFKDIVVEPVTYAVTVNGGAGAGNYEAGATVAITATVPEGKEFVNWTGDVAFADANAAATSFTMPANDVTVTANFKDIVVEPEKETAVTVVAGTATGEAGDTVVVEVEVTENTGFNMLNIVAKYDTNALEFVEVTSPVDKNELGLDTELTSNNDIRMMFEEANEENYTSKDVVLAELTFKIKDNCVVGDYAITLVAFDDSCIDADLEDVPLTLVNGKVVVVPTTYTIAVVNGSADVTTAKAGDIVTVSANPAAAGYEFAGWTGEGVTFADASKTTTTFTMPESNVTVSANYKELVEYAVTVNGGSANVTEAVKNTSVRVSAIVPEGKVFVNWTGNVEVADANAATTTFTMPEHDVTLTANFKDKPVVEAKKYTVKVVEGTADVLEAEAGAKVTITANAAPEGKTFHEWLNPQDGKVQLANKNAATTTFIMPDMDVTLTATYKTSGGSSGGGGGIGGGGGAIITPSDKDDAKQDTATQKVIVLTIGEKEALVDGKVVVSDVAPLIKDGRTYTPARFVAEQLGAKVTWDAAKQLVTVTKGDIVIELTINSNVAKVNGKAVEMDAAAFIRDSRTYTPARFVAEQLGAKVVWDDTTRQVTITAAANV